MFESLVNWYEKEARKLPWRETKDPYKIWLSEVILQQTRVEQGREYYHKFISRYPTIFDLADAQIDEILLLWQGLGYYSRARNLHFSAKYIVENYQGIFPQDVNELKKIKGIGDYTAAAIASFAFRQCIPVIDGNVYRVLGRYFAISDSMDTVTGKKIYAKFASQVINIQHPDIHNQAMMELGAVVCKPKLPRCEACPLVSSCNAHMNGSIYEYPVRKQKIRQRKRYFYYLIILDDENTFIEKRTGKDIWQGLYQFPLLETDMLADDEELLNQISNFYLLKKLSFEILRFSPQNKHILSHQILFARFIHIRIHNKLKINGSALLSINSRNLHQYAFPRLITRYLEEQNDII